MKIMDSKELMNDIGFKLQSSVGLSIVQVPVVYMFKSTTSIFFFSPQRTKFRKSYKHQELRKSFYILISLVLLATAFSFTNAVFHSPQNFFLHEAPKGDHLLLYLCFLFITFLALARVMPYFSNEFLRKMKLSRTSYNCG